MIGDYDARLGRRPIADPISNSFHVWVGTRLAESFSGILIYDVAECVSRTTIAGASLQTNARPLLCNKKILFIGSSVTSSL
mmetsp:Transcript_28176/g.41488  ORF Transcript_28176/g.41488 Transcript_28176/m.41488 type:complete len:81 (+) Transcript_28176:502-744(+)